MLVTIEQAFANFMFARALKRGHNVRRPSSTRRHKNRALDASRRVTSRMFISSLFPAICEDIDGSVSRTFFT